MFKEIQFIKELTVRYPRSPSQKNCIFESDAEIVKLADGSFFVGSIDAISEEISIGIVRDVQSLAWLTVTASVSDLCAVAVKTQSLHLIFSGSIFLNDKAKVMKTIEEAQKFYKISTIKTEFVDEISGTLPNSTWSLCAASAIVPEEPLISRMKLVPGDILYVTGPLGLGNTLALSNFAIRNQHPDFADQLDQSYRPSAGHQWVDVLQKFATTCVDTSDGCLMTLDLLMELNQVGIEVFYNEKLFHPITLQVSQMANVSPFVFFSGQNGEFQLIFSIKPHKISDFELACRQNQLSPLRLGKVSSKDLNFHMKANSRKVDLKSIRNLLHDGVSPTKYVESLIHFCQEAQINV